MANSALTRLARIVNGDADGTPSEAVVSRLERFAHFWTLVWRSFVRNRCPVRASALSYSTLLALIPMLAVAVSVTSSLLKTQGEEEIYKFVDKFAAAVMPPASVTATNNFPAATTNDPAAADAIATNTVSISIPTNAAPADARVLVAQKEAAKKIHEFIQNTRSGTLGITGMVLLVLVAIRMLANIEATFNDIWGVAQGRSWFVRVIQYWAAITLGPLLIIGAAGLAGGQHFQATKHLLAGTPFVGGLIFQFIPLLVLWLTFALLYQLVPNTRVSFTAAFVGGAVGGSLWHLNNVFGFLYVSRVVSNSKIYGSLGLVPVFMAGLYFSWLILLFGAQVAYAFQNRAAYLQEKLADNVNQRGREFVALRLMTSVSARFHRGEPPATVTQISAELGIPSRLAQQVLRPLLAARLVAETAGIEPAYAPARPLDSINAHQILLALRAANGQELVTRDEPARDQILGEFARIQEAEKIAATSVTMLALVNRAQLAPPAETKTIAPAEKIPTQETAAQNKTSQENVTLQPEPCAPAKPVEAVDDTPALAELTPAPKEIFSARPAAQPQEDRDFPL